MDTNKMRALKALAESATGGVWQCEKDVQGRLHVTAGDFLDIAEVGYRSGPNPEADAQFMAAARPEVVLALLAEIDRLIPFEEAYATACHVRNRLIRENEALRKDAERYRYMRRAWAPHLSQDEADAQTDAAMAKGASHD